MEEEAASREEEPMSPLIITHVSAASAPASEELIAPESEAEPLESAEEQLEIVTQCRQHVQAVFERKGKVDEASTEVLCEALRRKYVRSAVAHELNLMRSKYPLNRDERSFSVLSVIVNAATRLSRVSCDYENACAFLNLASTFYRRSAEVDVPPEFITARMQCGAELRADSAFWEETFYASLEQVLKKCRPLSSAGLGLSPLSGPARSPPSEQRLSPTSLALAGDPAAAAAAAAAIGSAMPLGSPLQNGGGSCSPRMSVQSPPDVATRRWRELAEEQRSEALTAEQSVVFGQIGFFVYTMLSLGVDVQSGVHFVRKMCVLNNLQPEYTAQLLDVMEHFPNAPNAHPTSRQARSSAAAEAGSAESAEGGGTLDARLGTSAAARARGTPPRGSESLAAEGDGGVSRLRSAAAQSAVAYSPGQNSGLGRNWPQPGPFHCSNATPAGSAGENGEGRPPGLSQQGQLSKWTAAILTAPLEPDEAIHVERLLSGASRRMSAFADKTRKLVGTVGNAPSRALDKLSSASVSHASRAMSAKLYKVGLQRYRVGCYAEAEELFRSALRINESEMDPNCEELAVNMNNLAAALEKQDKLEEACALCQRAHDIFCTSHGVDNPRTQHVASKLHEIKAAIRSVSRSSAVGPSHSDAQQAAADSQVEPEQPVHLLPPGAFLSDHSLQQAGVESYVESAVAGLAELYPESGYMWVPGQISS